MSWFRAVSVVTAPTDLESGKAPGTLVAAAATVDTGTDQKVSATSDQKEATQDVCKHYPLMSIFWTMLEFFFFFLWIWLAIMVFSDIFRSHDIGGGSKALWVIFIVLLPFLGVFAYLIFRGGAMHDRAATQAALQHKAFERYLQHVAVGSNTADQLHKLAELKEKGFITDAEFQAEKAKVLA